MIFFVVYLFFAVVIGLLALAWFGAANRKKALLRAIIAGIGWPVFVILELLKK